LIFFPRDDDDDNGTSQNKRVLSLKRPIIIIKANWTMGNLFAERKTCVQAFMRVMQEDQKTKRKKRK